MHHGDCGVGMLQAVGDLFLHGGKGACLYFKHVIPQHHVGHEAGVLNTHLVKILVWADVFFYHGVKPFFGQGSNAAFSFGVPLSHAFAAQALEQFGVEGDHHGILFSLA
jgi:hypothetical protein